MKDQRFEIYKEQYIFLGGEIINGCLHLRSEVYGDEYDSEKHYGFSKEETEKLFAKISLEDFIELCRKKRLSGMEEFLKENNIEYKSFTY